ncbi:MAG: guanylate kinase [Verrucomicrobia bacterium]|nr:guanylate kinase [Verrucomicrobiota bacterium]
MEKLLGSLSKGFVIIMSAPAGTGKTTLARMLIDEFPSVSESVSCTTRPMRPGEIADKDYHFMKEAEFEEKERKGEFLEHASVFGYRYGTLKEHVEKKLDQGQHVILVIDTQGALQLKKMGYKAIYIFIRPPSLAELRTRLFNRKTEEENHIEQRLTWAVHELEKATQYDYIVTNDNLHRAYEILRSILISEEHKTTRYHDRKSDQ